MCHGGTVISCAPRNIACGHEAALRLVVADVGGGEIERWEQKLGYGKHFPGVNPWDRLELRSRYAPKPAATRAEAYALSAYDRTLRLLLQ